LSYVCHGNLLCCHGVVERNRISSLQSHGKALEKECCLPGIFGDRGDKPANLLCELNGHLMPFIIIIIIIIIILTLVLNSQGLKKNYAMQYRKVQKSSWNEPYSSSFTKQSCSKMALGR